MWGTLGHAMCQQAMDSLGAGCSVCCMPVSWHAADVAAGGRAVWDLGLSLESSCVGGPPRSQPPPAAGKAPQG